MKILPKLKEAAGMTDSGSREGGVDAESFPYTFSNRDSILYALGGVCVCYPLLDIYDHIVSAFLHK